MKKTLTTLLVTGALAAVGAPALAPQAYPHQNKIAKTRKWEDLREPEDIERSELSLRYGRFMTQQFVATFSLNRSRFEGSGVDTTNTGWLIGAKYYFSQPRAQAIVPFVDGGIGFTSIDTGTSDSTDFSWEIGGGVSWFFTEATSFDAALRFFQTDTDLETKGNRILIGITTRF
jgi:opacity protein-like surface antigen